MAIGIGRRQFISGLGGATLAWPYAARAQQPALPVIGFLNADSPKSYARQLSAFLKGLSDVGYIDGHNVTIEYRWAEGLNDRLPALAADLVHSQVAVIAATTTAASLAAKAATTTIPIVFETGADPVQLGLVPNLNRPGGNITGVTQTNQEVTPKRLQMLHELAPTANIMALLVNPASHYQAETQSRGALLAAHTLGLELHVLNASTDSELDAVFINLTQLRAGGLVIASDPFFIGRSEQLAALTLRHAVPTIFETREFAAAGGLMSYGADIGETYRLAGSYTGRVLKGDKPADLPVQLASKVEFYINLKTAKALAITFPLPLLGRADEVIE
jgi:putative tryptophan/tyrosine transport system substrate-binding protein